MEYYSMVKIMSYQPIKENKNKRKKEKCTFIREISKSERLHLYDSNYATFGKGKTMNTKKINSCQGLGDREEKTQRIFTTLKLLCRMVMVCDYNGG